MNNETVARACGRKWGRILPVSHAAGYCGLTEKKFEEVYGHLIIDFHGVKRVDRHALDTEIDVELYTVEIFNPTKSK